MEFLTWYENYKQDDYTYIIAEIGGNFTTFEEAKKLVDGALYAGVDAVKLQTYRADTVSSKKAMFDMENTGKISQHELFKQYEVSEDLHIKVIDYIKQTGLDWFSTPAHKTDADMLIKLGMKYHKVGADDAVNLPFLKYLAKTNMPILLSSGLCTLDEVRESVKTILEVGNDKLVLFHTVSNYPTHDEDVNLNALNTLKQEFPNLIIGFSDHSIGPVASIAAASMGAKVIERHFTYDKNAEGPDHMLSSDPEEMKYLVETIRKIEIMRGSGAKEPTGQELQNRVNNRKSIVANFDIKEGEALTLENIDIKRPGSGIEPKHFEDILGKVATRDIKAEDILSWGDFS